jgi:hypothetical protein
MLMMNRKPMGMVSRITVCVFLFIGACCNIGIAVLLPGARAFFIIAALVELAILAATIIYNIHRNCNRW